MDILTLLMRCREDLDDGTAMTVRHDVHILLEELRADQRSQSFFPFDISDIVLAGLE